MQYARKLNLNTLEQRGVVLREEALEVQCPRCEAPVGEPCQGRRGNRKSCHAERHAMRLSLNTKSSLVDQITDKAAELLTLVRRLPDVRQRGIAEAKITTASNMAINLREAYLLD
ncbi:zinc finger domain-containing protein [Sulfitobacter sp. EhC04]|uniref:zinc finger domain-containing protein n=1 Tax=Sulfitobacter sp. EhC04 TaxID=1849168 RepID=UPI0010FE7265|nr:hypothetical protein [Sulfitobacter sp. EhC04]